MTNVRLALTVSALLMLRGVPRWDLISELLPADFYLTTSVSPLEGVSQSIAALSFMEMMTIGATQSRTDTLEEAKRQVGHVATLCGVVVAYACERPEGTSLLALDTPPSKAGISMTYAPFAGRCGHGQTRVPVGMDIAMRVCRECRRC